MKDLLKDVQTRLKMTDEEFEMYLPDADHATKVLAEEKIEFLPDFKLVFYAHMVSLAKRLKEDIGLDCGDDCPEDEVEREAIEVSEKIIMPLAEKYKRDLNRMEIVFAAIQLQLAMEMQQENN